MSDALKKAGAWVAVAALTAANWAVWLGWDQKYDEHPDGSVSGPYEAWQVAGLVVVLAALVVATALARRPWTAVLAPTFGMALAVVVDWSDDDSGLWAIGAGMVVIGMLAATGAAVAVLRAIRPSGVRPSIQN
ncbi:hypothetical protein [Actinocorallia populi]|uniref:hypothetical protein n=1 Tax=Actinocorallia populi TaxID=2079200 RepID=UPI000D090BB9|nr:hypothetical protein [Actinocorallia populi]